MKVRNIKSFFYQNKVFFLFVCLQMIILLYFLYGLVSAKNSLEIPTESTGGYYEGAAAGTNVSGEYNIQPGAYKVFVKYASQKSINNPSHSLKDTVADFRFGSESNPSAVIMDNIVLDDGHTSAQGRLWIKSFSQLKDLKMVLNYYGEGELQVQSIVLEEQVSYRYIRMAAFLLGMTLLNLIYIVFWAKGINLSGLKDRKKTVLCLLVISVIAGLPLYADFIFVGHDLYFHMQRIVSVAEELENHQFPVRMMTNMLNDYGYANSLFYCDIFLYLPAVLYHFMLPLRTCYQVYLFLVNMFTCFIGYFAFSRMARSRSIGLIGTAVYLFSSYRLINVHIRAAVGEYTAMCFLPLAVYGLWRIYEKESPAWKEWLPLSIAMSSIIQCHILTVEMVMLFMLVFVLVNVKKTLMPQRLSALIKAALTTAGISAWFVYPFLESMFCLPVLVSGEANRIQSSGLFLIQLFNFFIHGNGANVDGGMKDEMPLSIGLVLVFGIVFSLYVCLQRRQWNLEENPQYQWMRMSFVFGAAALVLTLECFPYDHLENVLGTAAARMIGVVQFSWRYLAIATVLLSVTVVMALAILKDFKSGTYKIAVWALICGELLFTSVFYWQYTQKASEDALASRDNHVQTMDIGMGEYLLKGTEREQLYVTDCKVVKGNATISSYEKIRGKVSITLKNEGNEEAEVLLPVLAYDHYRVHDIKTGTEYPVKTGDNNRIQISVAAGYEGALELSYVPPVTWRIAEIVSLIVTVFIIAIIVKELKRKEVK